MQFMLGHVMLQPRAGLCGLHSVGLQQQNQSGMQLFHYWRDMHVVEEGKLQPL